jgi:class 3 adenylate cyclase/streptogramin lyase
VPRSTVQRRLATVLLLDIVGSTSLASELGDARWHELLVRFRRAVRAELKRYGGREQDTAGDGFFATFGEPAQALRCATAIVIAVQRLGVDIRAGVHIGECEVIDGKLGGIAVHIGSRVMALAGAAEVLTTSTVRDLVAGSAASFEDRGTHELKGVDGSWHVYDLRSVETSLPAPLSQEESASRLALIPSSTHSRRRLALVGAGAACLIALAAVAAFLVFGRGASAAAPISLLRLDGRSGKIADVSREAPVGRGHWADLWAVNGTLWQLVGTKNAKLVQRDIESGHVVRSLPLGVDACTCRVAFGFGSVWLVHRVGKFGRALLHPRIDRIDQVSGRRLKSFVPAGGGSAEQGTIATGNGAVWLLDDIGTLFRINPITNRVTGKYDTGAIEKQILVPLAGYEWICECIVNQVRRYDTRTRKGKTFHIPTQAYLIGVDTTHGETLWLLDQDNATLTSMDPSTGKTEAPLGMSGRPQQAVIAFGSIWAAAGRVVDRLNLKTRERSAIEMPAGVWAGSIAADSATGSIWIGNSGSAPPPE